MNTRKQFSRTFHFWLISQMKFFLLILFIARTLVSYVIR